MFESFDDSFPHIDCIDYMKCNCAFTIIKSPPCFGLCPSSLLAGVSRFISSSCRSPGAGSISACCVREAQCRSTARE